MNGARGGYAVRVVLTASVFALVVAGCGGGGTPTPAWSGIAYPETAGEPSLRFAATTGSTFTLPQDAGGRAVVLLFGALRNAAVRRFLAALKSAATALPSAQREEVVLVLATTDPGHDSLTDLRAALASLAFRAVAVRGTYPLTEVAARAVDIDVEPVTPAGTYQVFGPQAVGFTRAGAAAVAWNLDTGASALEHDLRQLTG